MRNNEFLSIPQAQKEADKRGVIAAAAIALVLLLAGGAWALNAKKDSGTITYQDSGPKIEALPKCRDIYVAVESMDGHNVGIQGPGNTQICSPNP